MQIPSPNKDKSFDRIIKNPDGEAEYGVRDEHSPDEEIVHIPSGNSNHRYYVPEMVMNPEGCNHDFHITSMSVREIECITCHFSTSFIVGVNTYEENNIPYITLKGKSYKLTS